LPISDGWRGQPQGAGPYSSKLWAPAPAVRCDEQAGRDAAGKPLAQAGHDRQPGQQGIVGGGMRIIRQGIEEQVRQAVARKMLVELHSVRVDQSRRIDPARDRLLSQILLGRWVRAQQPQHACFRSGATGASRYRTSAA